MRTMSGEVEPRGEEDFGSDDADAESYLEEDNSSELMDRLRELEAENSALMLANENQREAYERCLDEVANHVVQALLNQKDLREECIKLKMLVFDLERQNRALCELFQQKLPNQSSTQYQLLPGLLPECNAPLHNDSAKPVETAMTEAQAKQASPGPRGPAAAAASSMEALSPFFKKKAHILEVLRKMEETDPLKFRPSPGGGLTSFCDYSQALMSAEAAALAAAAELPLPACKPRPCRCPCAESEATHVNGEVATATEEGEGGGRGGKGVPDGPPKLNRTQNHVISTTALSECHGNSTTTPESGFPLKPAAAAAKDQHQQQPEGADSYLSITTSTDQNSQPANQSQSDDCREPSSGSKIGKTTGEAQEPEEDGLKGDRSDESGGGGELGGAGVHAVAPGEKSVPQMSYCEMASGEVPRRDPPVSTPEKNDGSLREGPDSAPVGPERPDLDEVAGAAASASVSSPSKLLKFLKIPSMGERRGQGGGGGPPNPPVRLSPQLTRTSRIPCRTNNYEVYHSPVPSRRATTTERCRPPPPPPPARSESYPATHSAPTSPPQQPPDELRPLPAKELSYAGVLSLKASRGGPKLGPAPSSNSSPSSSSSSAARVSQRVPHYENVSDLSTAGQQSGGTQGSLTRSALTNHSSGGGGADRKLVTSLPEGSGAVAVGPPREQPQQQPASSSSSSSTSSSSSSDSSSEQDVDAEGAAAWRGRHSLPGSSSSSSSSALRRTRDGAPDAEAREVTPDPVTPDPLDPLPQAPPPPPTRRNDPSSIPRRAGHAARPPALAESGHHAFKDRLAALGKLRGSEEPQGAAGPRLVDASDGVQGCDEAPAVERGVAAAESPPDDLAADEQRRHAGFAGSLDGKARNAGGAGLKCPPQLYEPGAKPLPSGPPGAKQPELEALYSRVAVAHKTDSPKSRLGLPSPTADTPQLLRNHVKCPGSLNLGKPGPGGAQNIGGVGGGPSPGKIPPKSPSKPGPAPSSSSSSARAGRPSEAPPRYSSKSEERSKIGGNNNKKKNPSYGDSLPPPPPRPPAEEEKPTAPVLSPQSAIEKKVMRGIEENMLKLQEQDRGGGGGGGGGAAEVKQKASNGIASWFGLKKSKLPALSRKGDAPSKPKEEKREWRINIPSVGGGGKDSSNKMAARCREGVEGLNISTLMEKAEGLRRALEEERAYVDRSGRGHSCEVVMDQAQGQLAVMYRGGRSDNFMQQLLNRVDGKDVVPSVPQRRLSFDCKTSRPPGDAPGNHIVNHALASDLIGGVTTDENLAGSVHSQHFAGSGASTYTLDSGIGTFPLPDYGGVAGRSLSKARPGGGGGGDGGLALGSSPGRVGRRSRTLERDMSSLEECYPAAPHKQLIPSVQLGPGVAERSAALMHTAGVIHEDKEAYGAHVFTPRSKTWTFPSLKAPAAGPGDVYLAVDEEEEEEPAAYGSPFRGSVKPRGHPSSRAAVDPASLPVPAQSGLSRRGKSRTPSVPEMSREAGLELLRERPEEALSPSRPQVLETPESLSDSLYDSLSSCGSQG